MREIIETNQFKRDYRKIAKSGRYSKKDFLMVAKDLAIDKPLAEKHHDHNLSGDWDGCRECHIKPDWLLIYRKYENYFVLVRTGSHSELFS